MISATHLHVMVIHFPIALILTGFMFEIISLITNQLFLKQSALVLLIIGTLSVLVAYYTGNAAGDDMEEGTMAKAMKVHEQAATFVLWISIITATYYSLNYFLKMHVLWIRIVGIILFTLTVTAISRTGYLGGQLVYKHGAGVQLELPDFKNENK